MCQWGVSFPVINNTRCKTMRFMLIREMNKTCTHTSIVAMYVCARGVQILQNKARTICHSSSQKRRKNDLKLGSLTKSKGRSQRG